MRILITGGHLSPALSVLPLFKKDKVLYVGRKYALEGDSSYSLEYKTIRDLKIPFFAITSGRLQRKFTRRTIPSLLKLPIGFFQSFYILIKFRPDAVLAFGSYVSLPVIITAFLLRIPVVIHEQTMGAGASNRFAGRFAAKICVSWPTSVRYFPKNKIVVTGNPLRQEIIEKQETENGKQETRSLPFVYITGGSLGSHFINDMVKNSIKELSANFQILHQTGDSKKYKDFDSLEKIKGELGENKDNYTVKKFLSPKESAEALASADIVVSRSGINTVCELLYLGKPSLLIPLPFSQNNEQLENARFLKHQGLGEVLEQKNITPENFIKTLENIYNNIGTYKANGVKAKKLIDESSAFKIAEVVKHVYKKKKNKK